jgi:hypothetical protein
MILGILNPSCCVLSILYHGKLGHGSPFAAQRSGGRADSVRPSWAGQLTASNDKNTMGRLLGRLFVTGTTALIVFISYTPQFFIIWPWYGRELSIELLALLIPFKYDPCNPVCTPAAALMSLFKAYL